MPAFAIKLIAVLAMAIDHIGLFFFPQDTFLYLIGRISFPLFAWLVANGARHTKNIRRYLLRIFLLAVISQVPFFLANRMIDPHFSSINVLFTLFIGLFIIMVIRKTENKFFWLLSFVAGCFAANFLNMDYGAMGVLSIVSFYFFYGRFLYLAVSQLIILGVLPWIVFFVEQYNRISLGWLYFDGLHEIVGILALVFIGVYNNKRGVAAKYIFYVFYPLQYVIIYLILNFIN